MDFCTILPALTLLSFTTVSCKRAISNTLSASKAEGKSFGHTAATTALPTTSKRRKSALLGFRKYIGHHGKRLPDYQRGEAGPIQLTSNLLVRKGLEKSYATLNVHSSIYKEQDKVEICWIHTSDIWILLIATPPWWRSWLATCRPSNSIVLLRCHAARWSQAKSRLTADKAENWESFWVKQR